MPAENYAAVSAIPPRFCRSTEPSWKPPAPQRSMIPASLPSLSPKRRSFSTSISVLSPLRPILPDAIEIGRHGLLITGGSHRGLLLPQVPVEHGWDRTTFLEQTCGKASLPLDAWRNPQVKIEAFTAEVFADSGCEE